MKLKAARFLIENMPGHVTLTGEEIEKNNVEIAQARNKLTYFEKKVLQMVPLRHLLVRRSLHAKEDVRSIEANDLIHHINRCFELWHTRPWLKNIGSNDFFEYLLPYRAEEEQFDY